MGWPVMYLARIIGFMCTASIGSGALLWLGTKDVYPNQWVANGFGLAEQAIMSNLTAFLIVVGVFGLIGLWLGPIAYQKGLEFRDRRKLGATKPLGVAHDELEPEELQKEIVRDVSVKRAALFVVSKNWDWTPERIDEPITWGRFLDALQRLEQAAQDRDIPMWGKSPSGSRPYQSVPPDHWQDFEVNYWEGAQQEMGTVRRRDRNEVGFTDLMTSKVAVESLCQTTPDVSSLIQQRLDWIPTPACILELEQWASIGDTVEITRHDKPSYEVCKNLESAFKEANWATVSFDQNIHDTGSPFYFVGIQVQGPSKALIEGIAGALNRHGLRGVTANANDYFEEPFGNRKKIRIRVGIEDGNR